MASEALDNVRAFRFGQRGNAQYSKDDITQALRNLHGLGDVFALDTVGSIYGRRLFLRFGSLTSGVGPRLERSFGEVLESKLNPFDGLQLTPGQFGLAQPLTLSGQTVLPIAHYSPEDVHNRWVGVLAALEARRDDFWPGQLGLRVVLRPAGQDWREHFIRSAPVGEGARETNIDRELWNAKANGTAFHAQIQLVAIRFDRHHAVEDVARLAELVPELTGQPQAWKLGNSFEGSMPRSAHLRAIRGTGLPAEPWPELKFLEDAGDSPYVLSAEEVAALWPAWMPTWWSSRTAPPNLSTTGVALPAGPENQGITTASRTDGHDIAHLPPADRPTTTGSESVQKDAIVWRPAERSPGSPDPEEDIQRFQELVHSSRPEGLPVRNTPNPREMRRGRRRRRKGDSERFQAALARVRPSVMRQMGLNEVDIEIFNYLGDSPLSSCEELAYSWNLALTAVNKSMQKFKSLELVESVSVYIGGELRERWWIPEDCWDRVFDHWPLPHVDHMVRRLWNNPELVSAVYRLVGILSQENGERALGIVRWLWKRPFDAVAQWNDGWAAFLWIGVWKGREQLDRRLQECVHELRLWNRWEEPAWPGRFVFVVPNAWVEEEVWRAVCRRGWQESCATLNLGDEELVGELGFEGARRGIPPYIREEPPPLKANVERWVELLKKDPASHKSRFLEVIELYPGISASHLGQLTRINGTNVANGLACLGSRDLIHQPHCDGYSLEDLALARSARRDGVWSGLPGRRQGKKRTAEYPMLRWRRLRQVRSILVKFHAAGCRVAPGWLAQDGKFRPDGVVWLDGGPYGAGWHYLVDVRHVNKATRMRGVLNRALSDARRDEFPIMVICREEMEGTVWELGAGRPMLTSTPNRIRARSVVGSMDCAWLRYGHEAHLIGGQRRNLRRQDTGEAIDEPDAV